MTQTIPNLASKILGTRASIPFLRTTTKTALKVDLNRHGVELALGGNLADRANVLAQKPSKKIAYSVHEPEVQSFRDCDGDSPSSVVISWPDDNVVTNRSDKEILKILQAALRETHSNVLTTKPFFMLDGGGRRIASLSLLTNKNSQESSSVFMDHVTPSQYTREDGEIPGRWLQYYSMLSAST